METASDSAVLTAGLNKHSKYWIGLFNSAQQPGLDGSWVWANQYPYNLSLSPDGFLGWAPSQPPDTASQAAWCVAIGWLPSDSSEEPQDGLAGGTWAWFADVCTTPYGVLCEVQSGAGVGRLSSPSLHPPQCHAWPYLIALCTRGGPQWSHSPTLM